MTTSRTSTAHPAQAARRLCAPLVRLVNSPGRLVLAILGIWAGLSMVYAVLERKGPIESLWWGIVTGTTVGYGDFYPESTAGRGVASVLIVAMLVLVPIAIGHVIAFLVSDRNEFSHEEQVALAVSVKEAHDLSDLALHLVREHLRARHGDAWLAEHEARWHTSQAVDDDDCDDAVRLFTQGSAQATTRGSEPEAR